MERWWALAFLEKGNFKPQISQITQIMRRDGSGAMLRTDN
jgi:hypothetical protein